MPDPKLSLSSERFDFFLNRVFADFNDVCASIAEDFEFPNESGLTFAVFDRAEINASVFWHAQSSSYVIGFNAGFCLWAYELAIAASALEQTGIRVEETRNIYDGSTDLEGLQQRLIRVDQSLSSAGDGYALFVFFSIFLSVFTHELAHIVRGHVDYLKANKSLGLDHWDELYATELRLPESAIPLRVFELDADYIGAGLLSVLSRQPERFSLWARTQPDENRAFALWGFAMFTLALQELADSCGLSSVGYSSPLL